LNVNLDHDNSIVIRASFAN